ncbi:MAG: hypothetical protein C3F02_03530 [Parcubacteria group bacterium]|nr:MAG: hypothetical protein C3F02_03530 [Parcubacteria group bacterium]
MLSHKLSNLKNLPSLTPDKDWMEKTRYELLAEISAQSKMSRVQRLTLSERADLFFSTALRRFMPSLTRMIAAFLIISLGSGVAFAAQASVPGEMLWPMKRSMEQAELSLTFSQVKETEIHLKHVSTRLGEIDKILEDNTLESTDSVSKEKAINLAVRHLEKDVAGADASLKIVKEENRPSEVVALVKKVTAVTKEVKTTVKEKQDIVSDKVIGNVLKDAAEASKKVNDSAVSLAVQVHEEVVAASNMKPQDLAEAVATGTVSVETSKVDQQELQAVKDGVKAIVENEIKDASLDIQDIKIKTEAVKAEDLAKVKDQVIGSEILQQGEVEKVIKEMLPQTAELKLDQAKVLLQEGSIKDAMTKVTETKEVSQKAEAVLQKLDQIVSDSQNRAATTGVRATSTIPLPVSTTTPFKKIEASGALDGQNLSSSTLPLVKPEDLIKF